MKEAEVAVVEGVRAWWGGGEQEGSGAEPHRAGKRQQCALPSSGALLLDSKVCSLTGVLRREAVKRKAPKARFKSVFVIEDSRERSWVLSVKSGKDSEGECCPGLLGRQPYLPLTPFLP